MPDLVPESAQRLTLDLSGAEIPAEKFVDGVKAFLNLVKEVARTVTGRTGSVYWVVTVRPGSAIIDYEARPRRVMPSDLIPIIDTVEMGIVATEAGASQPPGFSDRAQDYTSTLAAILEGRERKLDRVRVWRGGAAHDVTLRTVANVDALSGIEFRDWGTLEGTLETITGHRGFPEFFVKDVVRGRSTRCYFNEELLDDVVGAFLRRVAVSGIIRYRRNGEPVSIVVEELMVFPRNDELPDFEDVRGILRGVA